MRWLALIALTFLSTAQEKAPVPVIHLNHAFVVPDDATYHAIRNSEFLRKEFGVNEERTTQRTDIRYTGIYFYGENTYFEFLKPDERNRTGAAKIAFGVDNSGELTQLSALLQASGIATETFPITRPGADARQVPWFQMLDRPEVPAVPSLGVWTIEYDPRFLREWRTEAQTPEGVRRADVLARYAKVLNQSPADRLMKDIVAVTLQLHAAGVERSIKECLALGMRVSGRGTRLATCEARDVRFELHTVPASRPTGIAALHFALRRAKQGATMYQFGSTRLVFGRGSRATWHLMPEPRPPRDLP